MTNTLLSKIKFFKGKLKYTACVIFRNTNETYVHSLQDKRYTLLLEVSILNMSYHKACVSHFFQPSWSSRTPLKSMLSVCQTEEFALGSS